MWFLVLSLCGLGAAFLANFQNLNLLAYVLGTPLVGLVILCMIPSTMTKLIRVWALTVTIITLLLCMVLWANYTPCATEPFGSVVGFSAGWQGLVLVRLEFGIDSLSLWMVLLTLALMPLAVLCSWTTITSHVSAFMGLLLVLESFLFGAFTLLDLLCFYVLYECSLLPMFLLIGLGGSRPRKVRAAYLLVLYTLVGSLAMLPCMLLMWSQAGSTSFMLLVHESWEPSRQLVLWWGLFLAFAVKVPMIPVHLWLPEAHVELSTAGSVLLAGVLLKLGTYGLLRFNLSLFAYANAYYGPLIMCFSLIGLIYLSLSTLRQVDLKKLVLYSSIAHMSMVTLALFTMSDLGLILATFLMLAHGILSPALFLCVGALYDRTHTKALKYLGGLLTLMPLFSIMLFIFSLCNMAMPLTPNFLAEFLCLCSIFAHNTVLLAGALILVILALAYSMWAYARVVHGMPKPYAFELLTDLNRREFWTFVPLILMTLWLGLKPNVVLDTLSSSLIYWHQASLAVKDPASWALALL
uniref:NADH-ubiquinone oxidoreductase chain 4 n=1 Tax=Pseudopediastrum sp. CL0201VA TaxID=2184484 RepID=A0A2Z4EL38_9CHLO|nr:NADH dehydrogenase subunit 4 [Pseudopediastrum sp. CL0201VA]